MVLLISLKTGHFTHNALICDFRVCRICLVGRYQKLTPSATTVTPGVSMAFVWWQIGFGDSLLLIRGNCRIFPGSRRLLGGRMRGGLRLQRRGMVIRRGRSRGGRRDGEGR